MNRYSKSLKRHGIKVVGAALFFWLLFKSDLSGIQNHLASANPALYFGAVILFIPSMWLKALRWRAILLSCSEAAYSGRIGRRFWDDIGRESERSDAGNCDL